MVGEMNLKKTYRLEDILTDKQVHHIVKTYIGDNVTWKLVEYVIKPAMDGIAGFLGDHMKAALHVRVEGEIKIVNLFVKRIPVENKPKAEFIDDNNYYRREALMFKLFEEFPETEGRNPWCTKAYIYTDCLLVLPDLAVQGYSAHHYLDTLDLPHVLLTVASIARFHAAYANYETKKSIDGNRPFNIFENYGHILTEPTFRDSPWLRAAAKLTVSFLRVFSSKFKHMALDMDNTLTKLYIEACDSLTQYEDTLNVLIHKDLWANNIMFKYENSIPINAILIDFQCLRYAPPTFDVTVFLYLNTSRRFREQYEREIFHHYYVILSESFEIDTNLRLKKMGYDENEFLSWCEKSRMFGMLEAIGIFPFVLMDPKTAEKTFDNPETYDEYIHVDRSRPVIEHARECRVYRERQLELAEEFFERYVLKSECD